MIFGSNGGAGPAADLPVSASMSVSAMAVNNGRPCFSQEGAKCKPTPRSVRKVSMQDSNAVIPPQVLLVARAASEADDGSDDDDECKQ
jgi:hypothetical protein